MAMSRCYNVDRCRYMFGFHHPTFNFAYSHEKEWGSSFTCCWGREMPLSDMVVSAIDVLVQLSFLRTTCFCCALMSKGLSISKPRKRLSYCKL